MNWLIGVFGGAGCGRLVDRRSMVHVTSVMIAYYLGTYARNQVHMILLLGICMRSEGLATAGCGEQGAGQNASTAGRL